MSNSFKLCPTHFSRGEKIFSGGGLVLLHALQLNHRTVFPELLLMSRVFCRSVLDIWT